MTREELLKYEYETKLAELREEQATCKHEWEDPKYDPEIQLMPRYKDRFIGSDYMPELDGFTEKKLTAGAVLVKSAVKWNILRNRLS